MSWQSSTQEWKRMRIFGAGNVARMLQQLPVHERRQAADSLSSEAHWRIQDPVYGSVGIISMLQHQIQMAQRELATTQAQISIYTNHHHHHHQQQQGVLSPDSTFMDLQHMPDLF
ncbi:Lateral organ boundaries LOB domain-containing protein [Dioscorea alata]|uniref:Lateral organ boundaries LOB domain-containing protein n=1 Tax=Dioscorea alata TaxID=55571 RepID=A0ACB7WIG6_DIOAL|nr:Lateral organ boundaries LOB domain-containing protein [Dioscorea alata]